MTVKGIAEGLMPLWLKLRGKLPLCPWRCILLALHPKMRAAYPPRLQIEEIERTGALKKLRFAGRHEAWFPQQTEISPELWSEYLGVFWNHPANGHYYLAQSDIRSGDICIDCGACEGFFAIQALERGAALVVCVEPSGQMAQCLELTLENDIRSGRALICNAALGATDGETAFDFAASTPFAGQTDRENGKRERVPLKTLQVIYEQLQLRQVDFVKMDIEGAELQTVEGATALLRREQPRLAITTYHRSFHYAALRSVLLAVGYGHIRARGAVKRGSGTYRPVMLHAWQ